MGRWAEVHLHLLGEDVKMNGSAFITLLILFLMWKIILHTVRGIDGEGKNVRWGGGDNWGINFEDHL